MTKYVRKKWTSRQYREDGYWRFEYYDGSYSRWKAPHLHPGRIKSKAGKGKYDRSLEMANNSLTIDPNSCRGLDVGATLGMALSDLEDAYVKVDSNQSRIARRLLKAYDRVMEAYYAYHHQQAYFQQRYDEKFFLCNLHK